MAQFNASESIVPITVFDSKGRIGFLPPGISTSSFLITGSAIDELLNQSSSVILEYNTSSTAFQFQIPSQSSGQSEKIVALHITSSGKNPRVGIGTTNPLETLDFKDVKDSTEGTKILLRSSRTSEGAQVGDSAGVVNFVIDSASFNNIELSGSIASIETIVSDIDPTGVIGELILATAGAKNSAPVQRIKVGANQTQVTGSFDIIGNVTSSGALFVSSSGSYVKQLRVGTTSPISPSTSLKVTGRAFFSNDITASSNLSASFFVGTHVTASSFTGSSTGSFVLNGPSSLSSTIELADIANVSTTTPKGEIIKYGTADSAVSAGNIYFLATDGKWKKTDANSEVSSSGLLGVAISTNAADGFLVRGICDLVMAGTTPTGSTLYLSATDGRVTHTPTSASGDVIRAVGYTLNGGTGIAYFNPDSTYIVAS